MSGDAKPREVKVVLLGDTGVGKSSLVLRFVTNNFKPYSESTIWDTAGQEKYHSLAPMYYRGAAAAILVYDITRNSTFRTLQNWVEELKQKGPKDIALAIAGNKADLADSREVDERTASQYADEIGAVYLETSAKDDTNVQDIFVKLSTRLPSPQTADSNVVKASAANTRPGKSPQKNGGCC